MCSSFDLTCPVVREQARHSDRPEVHSFRTVCGLSTTTHATTKKPPRARGSEVRLLRRSARRCAARFANCLSGRTWNCRTDRRTCIHARGDSLANGEHLAEQYSVEEFVQVLVSTEAQGR